MDKGCYHINCYIAGTYSDDGEIYFCPDCSGYYNKKLLTKTFKIRDRKKKIDKILIKT